LEPGFDKIAGAILDARNSPTYQALLDIRNVALDCRIRVVGWELRDHPLTKLRAFQASAHLSVNSPVPCMTD
jgi:hypothetical protein